MSIFANFKNLLCLVLAITASAFSLDKECVQIKRTGDYECASYLRIWDSVVIMYYTDINPFKTVKKTFVLDSVIIVDSVILSREIRYSRVSRKYILDNVPQQQNNISVRTPTDSKLFVLGSFIAIGSSANFAILMTVGIPVATILPGTVLGIALGVYLASP